jgi:alpha-beta hydrolase superfamily lysophospholipase
VNIKREKDILKDGYFNQKIKLNSDYDGENIAVLVDKTNSSKSDKAVLYIHGFIDYFFNHELGNRFVDAGYHFFALDLRKCGRALREGQHLHYSRNVFEYFEEIDKSIEIIKNDFKIDNIVLLGHSMGGLISSLYANKYPEKIKALILNSPFFDFNFPKSSIKNKALSVIAPAVSRVLPYANIKQNNISRYLSSLHVEYGGEWEFNQNWKPVKDFPVYFAWVSAIKKAQLIMAKSLNIKVPILLLHSKASFDRANPDLVKYEESDVVLNIEDMKKYIVKIGENVERIEIPKAIHDIFLSPKDVREKAFKEMFNYLKKINL